MSINELVAEYSVIIIVSLGALSVLSFILIIILLIKQHKLNKKYKRFMSGEEGKNLEEQILRRFAEIDDMKVEEKSIHKEISRIKENLQITHQKIGVVKYDAFKEMGGKLSFVLVILDKNDNGILLNSVHSSREGCYMYIKEIIKGESFLELSAEEKDGLEQAINSSNFME